MGTALVTGATSGIGREFCWQIAERGHNVVLVARDEDRLVALADAIHNVSGVKAQVLPADLSDPEDVEAVCLRLREGSKESKPIGLLVNSAGFGLGTKFLDNSISAEEYGLDVMVRSLMRTCHAAGNAMAARGRGAIINVSSVAADTGLGTYSAHKAWVRSFSEGLAQDLRGSGVTVTAMVPGLVHTEFHQRADTDYSSVPEFLWDSPKTVVERTLRAADRGQVVYTPTVKYKVASAAQKLLPRGLVSAVTRNLPHL